MNSLAKVAADKGIRYFLVSFSDLRGVQRAKLVPAAAIDRIASEGAGFAGFAAWLDMTPADPDVLAMADPKSMIVLPWKPEVAWVAGDLMMNGKLVEQSPRRVLARQVERAAELGYAVRTGVECEFFVLSPDGSAIGDAGDLQSKPCYDQQSLMRRYDLISKICDSMLELGWGPYQNDHEDANGQFEMNWTYDDALVTADRHAFFKYMVKTLAEAEGLRATFMPKPFANLSGNGCHIHLSLWDLGKAKNLFKDRNGELGLSRIAYEFIGGVLHHAEGLCALTNPTVNSFKRINGAPTLSGATWSPNTISYCGNNRTHMIRIPDVDRFELRLPDGATNPYLLQAAVIAAGLDGIAQHRNPGPRLDNNMYTDPIAASEVRRLPMNLLDALRALRENEVLTKALGPAFIDAYLKLKDREWHEHNAQISAWERQATLDC
ncbi:MAG TPA: type III glutamate--ammonia ligase [Polyangiaceae bacterium]|nr:type III glutamate--ammonia ligase [Polyangiaceae bacterium]